ncbi:MAG: CRISPR-associated protein Cas4 [Campylobacterota bacterium]
MNINGTLISYFFICKKKSWLHVNRINLEDNSEDVRIGKILHEINEEKSKKSEISIENIKIDKLTRDYLVEVKKSDSDVESVKWQVLLYLYKLKQKGVIKKGKIEFIEKNKQNKKIHYIELDELSEKKLLKILNEIETLINHDTPPQAKFESKCRKCAYYEYCFI